MHFLFFNSFLPIISICLQIIIIILLIKWRKTYNDVSMKTDKLSSGNNDKNILIIRELIPNIHDAKQSLDHINICYSETEFLSRSQKDTKATVDSEMKYIKNYYDSDKKSLIGCFIDQKLVGLIAYDQKGSIKTQHRAEVGIMIQKQYWNMGLGKLLFSIVFQKAKENNIKQLELGVMSKNERAINLYKKLGFMEHGLIKDAMIIDNVSDDELIMIKTL